MARGRREAVAMLLLAAAAAAVGGCDGESSGPSASPTTDASPGSDGSGASPDGADAADEAVVDSASEPSADATLDPPAESAPDAPADTLVEGAADADGGAGCSAPTGPLVLSTDFTTNGGLWDESFVAGGSVAYAVASATSSDGAVATLLFPAGPALLPSDHAGPAWATQLASHDAVGYGTYRASVRLSSCAPSESVVNGYFLYANDGQDHDGNGIIDNVEIDIEIVCDAPHVILLTAWTDYTDDTSFRKWSRAIDTSTGEWLESPSDHEYGLVHGGDRPEFLHPGFPDPAAFYDMGFRWTSGRLCFFAVLDGQEVLLWDLAEAPSRLAYVPVWNAASPPQLMFNVWHPPDHWYASGPASHPAVDAVMQIDWARYWSP